MAVSLSDAPMTAQGLYPEKGMTMIKRLTIARKLPLTFAGLAIAASTTIGFLSYNGMYGAMEEKATNRLGAASHTIVEEFRTAFDNLQTDVSLFSTDFGIVSATTTFSQAFNVLQQ